jgi:hypothetical protein
MSGDVDRLEEPGVGECEGCHKPMQPARLDSPAATGMNPAPPGVTLYGRPSAGAEGGERFRLRMSIKGKRAEEGNDDLVNHALQKNKCR